MTLATIDEAAEILGEKPGTLARWCRECRPGCIPGKKGRGHPALIDVARVLQWKAAPADDRQVLELATELPQLMASIIFECWRHADGFDKRKLAGPMAGVWYAAVSELLDRLREQNSAVPDLGEKPPDEIEHLRKIARDARF